MSHAEQSTGHRLLLENLIEKLQTEELSFYDRTQTLNYWAWHITAGIAFLSTVGASLTASLIDAKQFESAGRMWLILLPTIATVASGLLHLYKFREKEALREDGRIEVADIILNAQSLLADANDDDGCRLAFHQVRERHKLLEVSQHRRDIALRSDEIPKVDAKSTS